VGNFQGGKTMLEQDTPTGDSGFFGNFTKFF
jgi:hypothetical protein